MNTDDSSYFAREANFEAIQTRTNAARRCIRVAEIDDHLE